MNPFACTGNIERKSKQKFTLYKKLNFVIFESFITPKHHLLFTSPLHFHTFKNMKHYSTLISAISIVLLATNPQAQTTKEELFKNRAKMGSNYYAYEEPTAKYTRAPAGYKPFYISHYGRHGSRFVQPSNTYTMFHDILAKADTAGKLTDLGKNLLERAKILNDYAAPRAGDLTQLGVKQHQGIARRMVKNFPEVFKAKANIDAYASTSVRCVVSMAAFLEELRSLKPKVQIHQEASGYLMSFINPANFGKVIEAAKTPEWEDANSKLYKYVNPSRMMSLIFNDTSYVQKNIDPYDLMSKIYDIGNDLQDIEEIDFNFDDLWTDEELFARWQAQNAWWYSVLGYCPLTGANGPSTVKPLLLNILETADKAIAQDTSLKASAQKDAVSATLRFGHDSAILPLAALMQFPLANAKVSDMEELYKVWTDFKIVPMAANLQMIFFKSETKGAPILVKFLYNEIEQKLPISCPRQATRQASADSTAATEVAPAANNCPDAPYYRWTDVRRFYWKIMKD